RRLGTADLPTRSRPTGTAADGLPARRGCATTARTNRAWAGPACSAFRSTSPLATTVASASRRTPTWIRCAGHRSTSQAPGWTGDGRWIALRIPHLHVRRAALHGSGHVDAWRLDPVQALPASE